MNMRLHLNCIRFLSKYNKHGIVLDRSESHSPDNVAKANDGSCQQPGNNNQ